MKTAVKKESQSIEPVMQEEMTKKEARDICISSVVEACKIVNATEDKEILNEALAHWKQKYDSFVVMFGEPPPNTISMSFEEVIGYVKIKWFLIGAGLIED